MVNDFLRNWLQRLRMLWWVIGFVYPMFYLVLDVLLCLIFGGSALLRDLVSDPVHFYWVGLMAGAIPVVYIANWRATRTAIAALARNGIDVSAWRHRFFSRTGGWLQWPILVLSLCSVLFSFWHYAIARQDATWFSRLPWPVYLLRAILYSDLPIAYMIWMTAINLIDSLIAFNRVFVRIPSAIAVDIWQSDGLYGIKPAHELLLRQFGVGLLASFLPALMLLREAEQPYSWMYKAAVVVAILMAIMLASILLRNFSSAIGRVKLSAVTAIADELQAPQPQQVESPQDVHKINLLFIVIAIVDRLRGSQYPPTELLNEIHRTNLLIEHQIVTSLPSSLPLPGWFKTLGVSRLLLIAAEFYSLLRPIFGTPEIPDILRRLMGLD